MKPEKAPCSIIKTTKLEKPLNPTVSSVGMGSRTTGKKGRLERQEILQRLKKNLSNSKSAGIASQHLTQSRLPKMYSHVSASIKKSKNIKPYMPFAPATSSKTRATTKGKKRKRKKPRRQSGLLREAASRRMHQEIPLSKELSEIVGVNKLSRPGVIKAIWQYAKTHNLTDPLNGRQIVCDAKLSAVFPNHPVVHMFQIQTLLLPHFLYTTSSENENETTSIEEVITDNAISVDAPKLFENFKKAPKKAEEKVFKQDSTVLSLEQSQKTQIEEDETKISLEQFLTAGTNVLSSFSATAFSEERVHLPMLNDFTLRLEEIKKTRCTLYFSIPLSNTVEMVYRRSQLHFRVIVEQKETETLSSSPTPFGACVKPEESIQIASKHASRNENDNRFPTNPPSVNSRQRFFLYPSMCLARNALRQQENVVVLQGSLCVKDLLPEHGYTLTLQVVRGEDIRAEDQGTVLAIGYVEISQRSDIKRWSVDAVCAYIKSLHIPDFEATCRMYAINGRTLDGFTECDYVSYGLISPILIKRIMDGLRDLK